MKIAFRRNTDYDAGLRKAFSPRFFILCVASVVAALLVVFVLKLIYIDLLYTQGFVGFALQADLGFEGHSPWVYDGDELVEVLAIREVVADAVFDQAGLKPGDIVVSVELRQNEERRRAEYAEDRGNFVTGFYELLERARDGGTIVITVVRDANDLDDRCPLKSRPKRECVLTIKAGTTHNLP